MKISRVCSPPTCSAKIEKAAVPHLPIFDLIAKEGNIPERDMYNTFNMGMGHVHGGSKRRRR